MRRDRTVVVAAVGQDRRYGAGCVSVLGDEPFRNRLRNGAAGISLSHVTPL